MLKGGLGQTGQVLLCSGPGFVQDGNVCEWSTDNFTAHSNNALKSVAVFKVNWPKPADKSKCQDRFNKTRIKHFHELGVNVYVPECPKEVHALIVFFASTWCSKDSLSSITVPRYLYCWTDSTTWSLMDRGMVVGRVFLKSIIISLVLETWWWGRTIYTTGHSPADLTHGPQFISELCKCGWKWGFQHHG